MIKFYLVAFQNKIRWWPFSRILELAEGINWSHVEIVAVRDEDWHNAISIGSVFPRARGIKYFDLVKKYTPVYCVPLVCKKDPSEALMNLAKLADSKFYSFGQIFMIALRILSNFKLKWLDGIKLNLSRFLICTELCAVFMRDECGYELTVSPEMMTLTETKDVAINNLLKD